MHERRLNTCLVVENSQIRENMDSKSSSAKLKQSESILSKITITGNTILLKSDRVILPERLQQKAIELAHKGSHPDKSQMEKRLRSHFFFHDMQSKVLDYVNTCIDCKIFVDKKTVEPLAQHKVPTKNWEVVAVHLFGPMLSSNHVIVVQELGSKYPAAKLVSSTKAEVIPALKEIYNYYGNPEIQLSDDGPHFNSKQMGAFTNKNNIKLQNEYSPTTSIIKSCRDFYATPRKSNENRLRKQKLRKRYSQPITKQL